MTSTRLRRDPATRWRQCADGVLVMAPDALEPMFLPAPGDSIWRLLVAPRTVDELVAELLPQFDGDRALMGADVAAFVADLEHLGLVRP